MLHMRLLRRAASGEYDLTPDQLFSTIEQLLFTKVLSMAEAEGQAGAIGGRVGERSLGWYFARGGEFGIVGDRGGKLGEAFDKRSGAWKWGWRGNGCPNRGRTWRWKFSRPRDRSRFFILVRTHRG